MTFAARRSMDSLWQDLRYALRLIGKSPTFAAVVVLTLGLGIGANATIFTVLDQLLLRLLPVRDPHELVLLDGPGPFSGRTTNEQTFSFPMYRDFREQNTVFTGVLARFPASLSIASGGQTGRVRGELVSGNYFEVLGVRSTLGRTFTPDDDRTPGAHPVVMLSHGFWTGRFGSDPRIVGQTVRLNAHPFIVVGVAPPRFTGIEVGATPDVFVPLMMKAQMTPSWDDLENRRSRWLNVMARLKKGVSRAQAEAALNVLYGQILQEEVKLLPGASERFRTGFLTKHLDLLPGLKGRSDLRRQIEDPVVILMGMVGFVLLIACANVAGLLAARSAARQKEIAVRVALGAGRGRILRQLVVESLVLALLGGAFGLLLASWTGDALMRALPEEITRPLALRPDLRVAAFTFGLSVFTALVFGLAPAFQASRPVLAASLKDEVGSVSGTPTHVRFRKALVIGQVALSLLLLVGAGLFARSLHNLRSLDPGFAPENLLTFSIDPSQAGHDREGTAALCARLQERLSALPGVTSASLARTSILDGNEWRRTIQVDGYKPQEGENMSPGADGVAPAYFQTLGIRLRAGREFTQRDARGEPRVAVVNETMARHFWRGESALGRRFGFARDKATDIEVVGVVGDSKYVGLHDSPRPFVYIPYMQDRELDQMAFYVRTALEPAAAGRALRRAVQEVDPNLPVFDLKAMPAQIEESLMVERAVAGLATTFGLLATLLAAVGLYGVMSFTVARRTREIGLRMALGAEQAAVLWLVLQEVAVIATAGIAFGLPAAAGLARLVRSQLFGLSPADPLTLGLATAALAAVTLLAGYLPARRATHVDPMAALRYE